MALQSIVGDPLYCYMHTLIFWWIILYSTADVASSLLMFDAEGLVPCLLQQVLPLIVNHADAETILGDPKVCTKKYYCYSYFKSPFTDKNNLRICDQNKGVTHHLREKTALLVSLSLDTVTTKGHYPVPLQHQWKILPVTIISYIPLDKKKFVQEKTGWSYRISYYHYSPWQWYDRDLCYHTNPTVSIQGPRLGFSSFQ